ncbi:MAG: hypothetical protein ACI4U5_06540 [Bacilli bacterium]
MIKLNLDDFKKIASDIFLCDSPTGYTQNVISLIAKYVSSFGYNYKISNKGTLEVEVDGLDNSKTLATSAHVDTLGLMVRSIKGNGNLALTKLGGPLIPSLEGEYCKVITRDSKIYTGTILSSSPAIHVYPEPGK